MLLTSLFTGVSRMFIRTFQFLLIILIAFGTVQAHGEQAPRDKSLVYMTPKVPLSTEQISLLSKFLDDANDEFARQTGEDDPELWSAVKKLSFPIVQGSMYLESETGSISVYFVHTLDLIMISAANALVLIDPEIVASTLGINDRPPVGGELMFLTIGRAKLMTAVATQLVKNERFVRGLISAAKEPENLKLVAQRLYVGAYAVKAFADSRCQPAVQDYVLQNTAAFEKRFPLNSELARGMVATMPGRDSDGWYIIFSETFFGRFHVVIRFDEAVEDCAIDASGYLLSLWADGI